MPYNTLMELPPAVKKLPKKLQEAWMKAFNNAFEQYKNEATAFAVAWSVVNKMQESVEVKHAKEGEMIDNQGIFEALAVDTNKKRARVVLIKAGWSKNERYYPPEVLAKATPLFEGAKCYLDHDDIKGTPGRSVRELAGFYESVNFSGNQIEGDLQFLDTEAGRVGLELAKEAIKHNRPLAGLSIRSVGTLRKVEEGYEVESLSKVLSVDIVSDPAAGGEFIKLYESMEVKNKMEEITLEELKEKRPDLVQAISEEVESRVYGKKGELDKQLKEIREQNDKLAKEIAEWKQYGQVKETETMLERELSKSELPEIAQERIRKVFEGKVAKAEEIAEAVKAEKEYIAKIAEKKQVNVGNSGKEKENVEGYTTKLREIYEAMGYSQAEVDELLKIKRGVK